MPQSRLCGVAQYTAAFTTASAHATTMLDTPSIAAMRTCAHAYISARCWDAMGRKAWTVRSELTKTHVVIPLTQLLHRSAPLPDTTLFRPGRAGLRCAGRDRVGAFCRDKSRCGARALRKSAQRLQRAHPCIHLAGFAGARKSVESRSIQPTAKVHVDTSFALRTGQGLTNRRTNVGSSSSDDGGARLPVRPLRRSTTAEWLPQPYMQPQVT